jgi:very-short-patch-repair endonuclease
VSAENITNFAKSLASSTTDSATWWHACEEESRQIILVAADAIVQRHRAEISGRLERVSSKAGSQIELMMANALIAECVRADYVTTVVVPDWMETRFDIHGDPYSGTCRIEPQARIGPYRVDFLVEYTRNAGMYEPDVARRPVVAVIECDGHDFHERTKEQAQRDKERDRYLQSKSILALRYTGSEIFRDVFKCTESIRLAIEAVWNRQTADLIAAGAR